VYGWCTDGVQMVYKALYSGFSGSAVAMQGVSARAAISTVM